MGRPVIEFNFGHPKTDPDRGNAAIRELQRSVAEIASYQMDRVYRDVKTKTASYTMDPQLDRIILVDLSIISVNATITLPEAADADYVEYVVVLIANHGTPNTLTISGGASNIVGLTTATTDTTQTVGLSWRVCSNGTSYYRTDFNVP